MVSRYDVHETADDRKHGMTLNQLRALVEECFDRGIPGDTVPKTRNLLSGAIKEFRCEDPRPAREQG